MRRLLVLAAPPSLFVLARAAPTEVAAAAAASLPCGEALVDLSPGCDVDDFEDTVLLGAQQSLLQTQLRIQLATEAVGGEPPPAGKVAAPEVLGGRGATEVRRKAPLPAGESKAAGGAEAAKPAAGPSDRVLNVSRPQPSRAAPATAAMPKKTEHAEGSASQVQNVSRLQPSRAAPATAAMPKKTEHAERSASQARQANYSFLQRSIELIPGSAASAARAAADGIAVAQPLAWPERRSSADSTPGPAAPGVAPPRHGDLGQQSGASATKPSEQEQSSWLRLATGHPLGEAAWEEASESQKLNGFQTDSPVYALCAVPVILATALLLATCARRRRGGGEEAAAEKQRPARGLDCSVDMKQLCAQWVPRRPGSGWGPLPLHLIALQGPPLTNMLAPSSFREAN